MARPPATYAPKVIKAAGLADGFTAKELTAAMNTLFKAGRIKANIVAVARSWRHAVAESHDASRGRLLRAGCARV